VGAITDAQVVANANAARSECINLLQELLRINHHAVTDDARFVAVQNAGRNEVQRVALIAHLYGVASIGSAVVAHDHIMLRGEQINDLSFAFVSPLESNNGGMGSSINAVSSGHGRGSGAKVRRLPRSGEW
jgi:ethanolamine utilization microcompartment shell protein EutL